MLRAKGRFHVYVTLIFDPKVTALVCNFCCNLHTIENHCAKYEHPRKKNQKWNLSFKPQTALGICDLDLLNKVILVISNLCCNLHTISNHFAKYVHPPSKNERGIRVSSNKIGFLNI